MRDAHLRACATLKRKHLSTKLACMADADLWSIQTNAMLLRVCTAVHTSCDLQVASPLALGMDSANGRRSVMTAWLIIWGAVMLCLSAAVNMAVASTQEFSALAGSQTCCLKDTYLYGP